MYDIISIGAATVDVFVKSEQFILKNKLLSLPASSKNEISQSLVSSGGGATNSSVAFSRLGLKSACVALVGSDPFSQYILSDLKQAEVSTSLLIKQPHDQTDFSVILIGPDGSRSIMTNRGSTCLQEKQVEWDRLKAKWFYVTSLEGNINLLEHLIGFASESGIKVSLNPGRRELSQKKQLIPLLKYVDFLLLNRTEAESLTGLKITDSAFISKLSSFGATITAVTNGKKGVRVLFSGQKIFSKVLNINAQDETGAGDSFGSAFVAALIYGKAPHMALSWGVRNSASVVSYIGAKTGLLKINQIKKEIILSHAA